MSMIEAFVENEDGASAVEYGLIVCLISIAIVATIPTVGSSLRDVFSNLATVIGNAAASI